MQVKPNWINPIHLLAFGFGSGAVPKAPGTFGTLAACVLYVYLLAHLSVSHYLLVLLFASLAGVYICGKAARDIGVHDHGGIVWDEFVGMWITLLWVPAGWPWLVLGFVLFRLFDILKPWPINWLDQQVHGGWGIMLDDIVAGIMALACLQAVAAIIPV